MAGDSDMYDIDLDALETDGSAVCEASEAYTVTEDLSSMQVATIAGTMTLFVYAGNHLGQFLGQQYADYKGIEDAEAIKDYRFWGGSAGIATGVGVGYLSGKIGGSKIEEMIEERSRRKEEEQKEEA